MSVPGARPFGMHGLGRVVRWVALLALTLLIFPVGSTAWAQARGPLDPKEVPEALRPWISWALDGARRCPAFYEHDTDTRCAWPARLELSIGDHGGSFVQSWHVDAASAVPLPGDAKRFPVDVTLDGRPAIVITSAGDPRVELSPGDHVLRGAFAWDTTPDSLAIPKETGLVSLSVRGAVVAAPHRDADGTLFFQKASTSEEGNALKLVVHREVSDDIPLRLVTRIELHVSGKSREELTGKALPPGFVPMALSSPLPARIEPDGRVRVQVRPGVFTLELTARAPGPTASLTRPDPDGPWNQGDEVWVFEAKSDLRVVTLEGVASIDPQQTTLPDAWKKLPAYSMPVGATMRLVEKRRGDEDPPPDQLSLSRTLWLDFDGKGYTVQDQLTGSLNRESRLTMAAPSVLGRVAIDGRDQFITAAEGAPAPGKPVQAGVEVRQGKLSVTADSRIDGDPAELTAVGWSHDFRQVSGTLHLPPGWSLLYATGVDDVPGTWVRHWTLLELFIALMVAIAIGRLHGVAWGGVALVMLVLTLPESGAAQWVWLPVLVFEALTRVIPAGRVRRLFEGGRVAAFLLVVLTALPFVVRQVRQGLHPVLAEPDLVVGSGQVTVADAPSSPVLDALTQNEPAIAAIAPAAPPPVEAADAFKPSSDALKKAEGAPGGGGGGASGGRGPLARGYGKGIGSIVSRDEWLSDSLAYDPAAIVQTGPGLPHWRWTSLDLRWSGPVASAQRIHLYLVSPGANLVLALLRGVLVLLVVLRLLPFGGAALPRFLRFTTPGATLGFVAFLTAMSAVPGLARADVPDKATLDDLKARLTRTPSCSPTCASSGRLAVDVHGNVMRLRMEIDVAATTVVPLPGNGAQWNPSDVRVDGQPAKSIARVDDVLRLALEVGAHQVVLEGAMPDRASVQLSLPMKPHHVSVSAVGWTVAGVHEDGLADDDLQFTRIESSGGRGHAETSLQPGTLPPFVAVERTLHVGLDWEMETHVRRLTPLGAAVVLEVPLVPGERVTTADVRVVAGRAQVFLGPEATQVVWRSVLAQVSPIRLVAPRDVAWVETWRMDVGTIWHASYSGIPFVHVASADGTKIPEWRPWPGEEAQVTLTRPGGVAGQTLTIDESTTTIDPGLRATDVTLSLSLRSSRGGDHTLTLPEGAQLESLSINGGARPLRQDGRRVTISVVPGAQALALSIRVPSGVSSFWSSPEIDLGAPSVNATTVLDVGGARWLLFASGPRVGPAVLFWSLLVVLLVVAVALGQNRWTPLRTWHWALLFVGLSQVDVVAGAFFVGWLLALGARARYASEGTTPGWFNLGQALLVVWTIVALVILAVALHQGLLGTPEMQVSGNGSNAGTLRWFVDRAPARLPTVRIVSLPLLVYRGAMLAWALWIVLSLLSWIRWGFQAFTQGGGWRKRPPRAPRVPAYTVGDYPQPPTPAPPPPPAPPASSIEPPTVTPVAVDGGKGE